MHLTKLIDDYIADQRATGRFTTEKTAASYRNTLYLHAADAGNRDIQFIGKEDIRATLRRWENPNTQRNRHSHLASFYQWAVEEGYRNNSPAAQVRRARPTHKRQPIPTTGEVQRMLEASWPNRRTRWVIWTLALTGVRNAEMRALTGRAYRRAGFVHVERGKGGKERWIPVLPQYRPVAEQIRDLVADHEYVLPSRRCVLPPANGGPVYREIPDTPTGPRAIHELVTKLAIEAGVPKNIGPHALRRGFLTHIQRTYGAVAAQAIGGHSSIDTTMRHYVAPLTPEELERVVNGPSDPTGTIGWTLSVEAPTGFEPVIAETHATTARDSYPQEDTPHDA